MSEKFLNYLFLLFCAESVFFYHHSTHTGGDILFGPIFVAPEGEIIKKYGEDKTKLLQFCQEQAKDMCPLVQQMTQAVRPEDLEEVIDLKDREPLKLDSKTGRYWYCYLLLFHHLNNCCAAHQSLD